MKEEKKTIFMSDELKEKLNKFVEELERVVERKNETEKRFEIAKNEKQDESELERISDRIKYWESKKTRLENAILNVIEESKNNNL